MKMYILLRESVPVGFAVLAAAHTSLAAACCSTPPASNVDRFWCVIGR